MSATTNAARHGFRMWMPNMPMTLIGVRNAQPPKHPYARATFKVLPSMTKHEVKEYITKIYDLPVKKVNTQNFLGKRMRIIGKRRVAYRKEPDWKKAIVTFEKDIQDLGVTTELEFIAKKDEK